MALLVFRLIFAYLQICCIVSYSCAVRGSPFQFFEIGADELKFQLLQHEPFCANRVYALSIDSEDCPAQDTVSPCAAFSCFSRKKISISISVLSLANINGYIFLASSHLILS